ncbi:hypothetical protein [Candidatus Venteria ishoeyi]|uniref:Uncharacterized protein n=1 Tax=Candidatus Venteria ishoeyi TaxID=1899563 RepID=A0A1H6F5U4_9GAMM|nr:hypothetical protein [Candidatus Venteria ishoeyi]SEH04761.1 Uncharacterised protein [Candidatus Venteria ishoeyi]
MLKKTVLSLALAASMGLMGSVYAADFGLPSLTPNSGGSGASGAKIGGDSTMDIDVGTLVALGVKGSAKAMVGHISDGSSIGGDSTMKVRVKTAVALGVGGDACLAIGTVGGHC